MHGPAWTQRLRETVVVLQSFGSLPEAAPNGMTAIAQAIDFHDVDVFSTLVDVEPILVSLPLVNPRNTKVYNLPIHFAAQMAARRDVPGAARILEIIHTRNKCLAPQNKPPMDSMNRTPLHMAVTGPSSHATKWLLQTSPGLLNIEDDFGRTALHCCASGTNAKVLLAHGANIDHTDKAGMTALHMACFNGNIEIVQTLLSHTEKPNLQLK
ncbi:ankyrin repeat-containing domain protein, partial [Apodospora peruviana]